MEAFHVTCETCHARLKIRSESVIGQIHACPKCESMVHIVPPPGWVPSTTLAAASSPASAPVEVAPLELPAAAAGSSILVWSMGGVALVLVGGLAAVMWPRGDERAGGPAAVAANESVAALISPVAQSPAENADVDAEREAANDHRVAQLPSTSTPEATPVETAVAPPEMPEEVVAVAAPEAAEPSAQPASPPLPSDTNNSTPVLKFDPLDFDPSQLSLGGTTAPASAETSSSVADATVEPIVVDAQDDLPADQKPGEPVVGDPSVTVRLGPESTDALRPRNVAEQLALKVDSIDLAAVPLSRFAEITAEMGNVAITLDPATLAMAGVSPRATVAVQARDTTLEKLLRDSLAKLRLDFVERDGQVVIIHPSRDVRRGVDYDVKDLLETGAKDATAMSDMIQRLVAPDSWQGGPGGGAIRVDGTKLHVEHVNRVQIQILMFCERLRLARGLPPRSRYPAERLSIDSPYAKLSATLAKPTTFTFLPWTRLADVVRQWQESTGVTILVDWQALAKEELAPATPIACSAINRPWDAALDAVLEPLGLAWWAIDGETIQITSRSALGQLERIEFYPVPKGQKSGDDVADGATHVEFDAPSGRLIVLGSPDVQRLLSGRLGDSSAARHDEHDSVSTHATPVGTP